jgi:hypothetical protein
MSRRIHVATFPDGHLLVAAAAACRARGLEVEDAFSPHPIHGIDEVLGIRRTRLPIVCFAAGLLGGSLGLAFEYWASAADWPLDVGGKPFDSLPAFLPVAFEMTVLFAGLATALALFVRSRLAPGAAARTPDSRVTDDRYVLVVRHRDAALPAETLDALLVRHGATSCREEVAHGRREITP